MVFGPLDMAHTEKFSLHQRHMKKANCWAHDPWFLVSPVAGVTPMACFQNLPCPHSYCRSGPLLRNSLSQTFSDTPFMNMNPAVLNTLIANCLLRNEYSF